MIGEYGLSIVGTVVRASGRFATIGRAGTAPSEWHGVGEGGAQRPKRPPMKARARSRRLQRTSKRPRRPRRSRGIPVRSRRAGELSRAGSPCLPESASPRLAPERATASVAAPSVPERASVRELVEVGGFSVTAHPSLRVTEPSGAATSGGRGRDEGASCRSGTGGRGAGGGKGAGSLVGFSGCSTVPPRRGRRCFAGAIRIGLLHFVGPYRQRHGHGHRPRGGRCGSGFRFRLGYALQGNRRPPAPHSSRRADSNQGRDL